MCLQASKFEPEKKVMNCQSGSVIFVPVLSLLVSRGSDSVRCTFLLDAGAQFITIKKQLLEKKVGKMFVLQCQEWLLHLGCQPVKAKGFDYRWWLLLSVMAQKTNYLFFAMDYFSLLLKIPMLTSLVENLESAGHIVPPNFPGKERDLEVLGILGNDILQNFRKCSLEGTDLCSMYMELIPIPLTPKQQVYVCCQQK